MKRPSFIAVRHITLEKRKSGNPWAPNIPREKWVGQDAMRRYEIAEKFQPVKQIMLVSQELSKPNTPRRVGVETGLGYHEGSNFISNPTARFVRALIRVAKRKEIELVDLEKSFTSRCLSGLQTILVMAMKQKCKPSQSLSPGYFNPEFQHLYLPVSKMVEKIEAEMPEIKEDDLDDINTAVGVARSLLMLEEARREGTRLNIAGSLHAIDLHHLRQANVRFIDRIENKNELARYRIAVYSDFLPIIEELKRIAKSHEPAK